jgi:hypothetical protein
MPGVKEDQRGYDPHDICRSQRDDDGEELSVAENLTQCKVMLGNLGLNRFDSDKDRGKTEIYHNEYPKVYHRHIESVGSLRSVSQGQYETRY